MKTKTKSSPKTATKAATKKALALAKVHENRELFASELLTSFLPDCLANVKALADGVTVTKGVDRKGRQTYYKKPPNLRANMYLIDRLLGGPRRAVELTGKDGGAIPITIILPHNGRDPEAGAGAQSQLPSPGDVAGELG